MFTVSVVPTICLTPHSVVSMECGVILNYHSTHHATVEKSVPWSILVSLDQDYLKNTTSLNVANDILMIVLIKIIDIDINHLVTIIS